MRRERNKLAAAKCRNRRRELTEMLQGVSRDLKTGAVGTESGHIKTIASQRERWSIVLLLHLELRNTRASCFWGKLQKET